MSDYTTNATMERLAERIDGAGHLVVLTHRKPDGDAIGSALALHRALAPGPAGRVRLSQQHPLRLL